YRPTRASSDLGRGLRTPCVPDGHPRGSPRMTPTPPALDVLLGDGSAIAASRTSGEGPPGRLPIDERMLREAPSGHLFGLTQNAGMGCRASEVGRGPYLMVRTAARTFAEHGALPFAVACSDPCDGRTQGTAGMFDSLPYRNDAAVVMRRLVRSLPVRRGVLGVATCDKGLPAMMLALAGCGDLPGVIVPGGVTLPARGAEDTAIVQTIGARVSHGLIDLEHAAAMGCRACGSPGGGCQFLGTAATSQVVAEAL